MANVTVSKSYRITIPKAIREQTGLQPGDRLTVVARGRVISLLPQMDTGDLFGAFPGLGPFEREEADRES